MSTKLMEHVLTRLRAGGIVGIEDDGRDRPDIDLMVAATGLDTAGLQNLREMANGDIQVAVGPDRLAALGIGGAPPPVVEATRRPALAEPIGLRWPQHDPESAAGLVELAQALASPSGAASDFRRPGPVAPLRARQGGVLRRIGHTEAATDLARLAGLGDVALIAQLRDGEGTPIDAGTAADQLAALDVPVVAIGQIIHHRRSTEQVVFRVAEAELPTAHGTFAAIAFHDTTTDEDHVAIVKGDLSQPDPPLVRVHSECLTGDALGSLRCDCGEQLDAAMHRIETEGRGVVLYMRQEGRGIGLANKLRSYQLQQAGLDTVEANRHLGFAVDLRDYGVGAQILRDLGLRDIRLLTNNPKKIEGFRAYGLNVVEQIPLTVTPGEHNRRYLETKRTRMGHAL